jgi:hypothetical protein
MEVMTRLSALQEKVNSLVADYTHTKRKLEEGETEFTNAKNNLEDSLKAQEILQHIAENTQNVAHKHIAGVVSRVMKGVFGEDAYEFKIDFVKRRGKTEAEIKFIKDDLVLDDPKNESGGGAIQVAAFALRVACLLLSVPVLRRVLCFDEPLLHVNGVEYRNRISGMLRDLSNELGIQFIIASDMDWLKSAGKEINLEE